MRIHPFPRKPSAVLGFTIVEVLIVIIIIIILAGLLLPAVLHGLVLAKQTATKQEINAIRVALDKYQTDFGTYPPSCIWWQRVDGASLTWPTDWPTQARWHMTDPGGANTYKMNGAECLVYFLGGGPFRRGFTVGTKTFGPYMDIQPESLVDRTAQPIRWPTDVSVGFGGLQDKFTNGGVYLYFKADRSLPGSEYNLADNAEIKDAGGTNPDGSYVPPSPGEPIRDPTGNYYLPTSYQVISAGRDGRYARRVGVSGDQDPSKDDITNFSK
jgi:type II secretory pathway pseudopilin PulG